jgi:hypothetical protein
MPPKRGRTIKQLTGVRRVLLGTLYNKCANPATFGLATEADLRKQAEKLRNTGCLDCSVDELTQTLIDVCELKEANQAQASNMLDQFKLTKTVNYKGLPSCFHAGRGEECMAEEFGEELGYDVCVVCSKPMLKEGHQQDVQAKYEELMLSSPDALANLPRDVYLNVLLPYVYDQTYSYYSDLLTLPCGHTTHTRCHNVYQNQLHDTIPCRDSQGHQLSKINRLSVTCPECQQESQLSGVLFEGLQNNELIASELNRDIRDLSYLKGEEFEPYTNDLNDLVLKLTRLTRVDSRLFDEVTMRYQQIIPVLVHEFERIYMLHMRCELGLLPCSGRLRAAHNAQLGLRDGRSRKLVEDPNPGNCSYKGPTVEDVRRLGLLGTNLTKAYAEATGKTVDDVIVESYNNISSYFLSVLQLVQQGTIKVSDTLPPGTEPSSSQIEIAKALFKVPEARRML